MDIKDQFYSLRKTLNLRQRELAEKIGFDQSMISKYERGQQTPTFENIIKIANKLNVSILDFIPPKEKKLQELIIGVDFESLSPDERELLLNYRLISKDKKGAAQEVVKSLTRKG